MVLWSIALSVMVNTVLICVLFCLDHKNAIRYIKLEEWTEDWLKRLEQKHDALECQIVNAAARIAEMERKYGELEKMFPKDGNNEVLRHNVLLQQMNDEMERSLKMEREWNDGLSSIMNYGKPNYEVNET